MATVKALLDANVLIPHGMRQTLETYARLGFYEGYWSPWIIEEMARSVTWRWIRRYGAENASRSALSRIAKIAMSHLEPTFRVISPTVPYPSVWPTLRDPGDHPVWAAAVTASVDYIVSDNTKDFPPRDAQGIARYQGITYITFKDFIEGIEDGLI